MHLIERDSKVGRFVFYFCYFSAWNIILQEMRFSHRFYVARITPISTLLEIQPVAVKIFVKAAGVRPL